MGTLPTGIRAKPGVRSLRRICRPALLAHADAGRDRRRPVRMKPRADRVASVEPVPSKVLHAAHGRPFDPAQASDRYDVGAHWHEGHGLLSRRPVRFEQQPRRQDVREVRDHGVNERAGVGRIGDDRVGGAAIRVEHQGILARRDVARMDTAQPQRTQLVTFRPVACRASRFRVSAQEADRRCDETALL